jgi:hypothetical protein
MGQAPTASGRDKGATPAGSVLLRPYDANDFEKVLALYAEVFGQVAALAFERRFQWSQIENMSPESSPKWVLEQGGAIVGFLGTVPVPYVVNGTRVLTHSTCDYMVKPTVTFHGIKLMREAFKHCSVVSLDDIPATIAVSKFLKARSVAIMERHVKVLDARLLARKYPGVKKLPHLLFWPSRVALAVPDRPRALLAPRARTLTEGFDARFDRLFQRCLAASSKRACVVKDARYLTWRYGPRSPHSQCVVGVIGNGDGIDGYVVCGLSNDDEHTGFILDLVTAPDALPGAVDGLVAFALKTLRRLGAWLVRWHVLADDDQSALARWGFRRRAAKHELLVRLQDPNLEQSASAWAQQFGDTEASHGALI